MMQRAKSPSNRRRKQRSYPVVDENKEHSVERVEVCTPLPQQELKEVSAKKLTESKNEFEKIPCVSYEKLRFSRQKSEPLAEASFSLPDFFRAASETRIFNREWLADDFPFGRKKITISTLAQLPDGEYGEYLKWLQNLGKKLRSGEDHDEVSPLMRAIIMNETEELDLLVENNPGDLNSSDDCGRTVIFAASALGHEELVEKLLEHDPLMGETLSGETALDYAKACERWPVVKLLNEYARDKENERNV